MTEIETFLSELWAAELHVERVTPADYFVELGGDSIAIVICQHRIRDRFDVEIGVETLVSGSLRDVATAIAAGSDREPAL